MIYWLVFAGAFGAATLLPFSSEVAVVGAVTSGANPFLILVVASLGNTLGSTVNWGLGRFTNKFKDHRRFPFSDTQMIKAEHWFQRFGVWSLLFAWMPIVGDALTYVAGVLRVNILVFFILTGLGKTLRYAVLIALSTNFI